MGLDIKPLAIPDVLMIRTAKFNDARGSFSETYNKKAFAQAGIALEFVQDNHSHSAETGTVRGLHYQGHPFVQDKLVRVVSGRILDVAVDIRRASPTFGESVSAEISADDGQQILVPAGFAHGFCTLEPDTQVFYKVTNFYSPPHDFGIRWNDPDLNIDWPVSEADVRLSDKDRAHPFFREVTQWL
jgi:dTDP-4-dehydrorhamnose 3,5-epimerase